ncbi:MAG TPA: TolC family protein [Longimicrobium sp.]|nr:TolC family protein [Longimicrobium sp.]
MSERWRATVAIVAAGFLAALPRGAAGQGGAGTEAAVGGGPFRAVAAGSGGLSAEAPSRAFWVEIGDATLERLVEEALSASPDVRAAGARIREAQGLRGETAFDRLPAVTSSGSITRSELAASQLPGAPTSARRIETWDGGVSASWELDVFGRVRRSVGARTAGVAAAQEDLRDVRLALAAEVARSYFDLVGLRERVAVARRNAENQRRTLALVEERLRAGRGSAFDTERAKAQLNATLASVPLLEASAAAAENRIAVLVGRDPTAGVELGSAAALPALPEVVRVGSPRRLVATLPEVVRAERRLSAQTQLVSAQRAGYMPRLSLIAGAGLTSGAADDWVRDGAQRYTAGVQVSWPFLDMGRVRARVGSERAREEEARALYSASVLRALERAETSLAVYERTRARLGFLAEAARASERAAELARIRFREGVADFLSVLDAERSLLDAQNQLTAARVDAALSLVDVYQATGQGVAAGEEERGAR